MTFQYAVIKNVIPRERAEAYASEMYAWLESFGKGFDRNDRSTWKPEHLPIFERGGLYHRYGVGHEQFAWDIRSEPGVVDAFAKIWGTDELLVSFDSANISLPFGDSLNADLAKPWPHCDQSPTRPWLHCVQGIVNLHENGPDDGGLMVLEGSTPLFEQFFKEHQDLMPEGGWNTGDWYDHKNDSSLQWFYDRGCKWKKVEAGPGDLILWDSRTVHYGDVARGSEPRIATYVCYKPAADISEQMLKEKKEAFENCWGSTHDPINFRITAHHSPTRGWKLEEGERTLPRQRPVLSERALKLAGVKAY